jgi:hypothetical protein
MQADKPTPFNRHSVVIQSSFQRSSMVIPAQAGTSLERTQRHSSAVQSSFQRRLESRWNQPKSI